MITFCL